MSRLRRVRAAAASLARAARVARGRRTGSSPSGRGARGRRRDGDGDSLSDMMEDRGGRRKRRSAPRQRRAFLLLWFRGYGMDFCRTGSFVRPALRDVPSSKRSFVGARALALEIRRLRPIFAQRDPRRDSDGDAFFEPRFFLEARSAALPPCHS